MLNNFFFILCISLFPHESRILSLFFLKTSEKLQTRRLSQLTTSTVLCFSYKTKNILSFSYNKLEIAVHFQHSLNASYSGFNSLVESVQKTYSKIGIHNLPCIAFNVKDRVESKLLNLLVDIPLTLIG